MPLASAEEAAESLARGLNLYRLEAVAEQPIHWPGFSGATLRGALGHALRELECMTGQTECHGCPLLRNCRYPALFEPRLLGKAGAPTPPPPYVIRTPAAQPRITRPGDTFTFEMLLCHLGTADIELMHRAWHRALRTGLGTRRGRARLVRMQPQAALTLPEAPAGLNQVTLEFISPVRLQYRGKVCRSDQLSASIVTGALKRRLQALVPAVSLPDFPGAEGLGLTTRLERYRWERQSSRQGCTIRLDGPIGQLDLTGPDLIDWWPWLWLGQYLHIGKNVSHGLGQYRLIPASSG